MRGPREVCDLFGGSEHICACIVNGKGREAGQSRIKDVWDFQLTIFDILSPAPLLSDSIGVSRAYSTHLLVTWVVTY